MTVLYIDFAEAGSTPAAELDFIGRCGDFQNLLGEDVLQECDHFLLLAGLDGVAHGMDRRVHIIGESASANEDDQH